MQSRSITRALLFVLLVCLAAGPALAAAEPKSAGPPVDLTGNWYGTFKAGQDRGTISLVLEQSGITSGTFYGAAISTTGAVSTLFGDYAVQGRKVVSGTMFLASSAGGMETGRLKGKATKTTLELKLKVHMPDVTAKVTLVRQ